MIIAIGINYSHFQSRISILYSHHLLLVMIRETFQLTEIGYQNHYRSDWSAHVSSLIIQSMSLETRLFPNKSNLQQQMKSFEILQKCIQIDPSAYTAFCLRYSFDPQRLLSAFPSIVQNIFKPTIQTVKIHRKAVSKTMQQIRKLIHTFIKPEHRSPLASVILPLWPLFLRGVDPLRIRQQLQNIVELLQISSEHVCFLILMKQVNPECYPEFYLQKTLQHFQTPLSKITISYQLIDTVLNNQTIQILFNLATYFEKSQPDNEHQTDYEQQNEQNPFIAHLHSQINRLLLRHKKLVLSTIHKNNENLLVFIQALDKYFALISHSQNILQIQLKQILLIESIFEYCSRQQRVGKSKNIFRILVETVSRIINVMYSMDSLIVFVVLQWILQGRIWRENQEIKTMLLFHLITKYEYQGESEGEEEGGGKEKREGKNKDGGKGKEKEKSREEGNNQENTQEDQNKHYQRDKNHQRNRRIIRKYISQIISKYYEGNILKKVPKLYLSGELKLLKIENILSQQGTISLEKLQQNKNNKHQARLLIFQETDNLNIHKIIIYLKILLKQTITKNGRREEDKNNKSAHQNQRRNNKNDNAAGLMKIYYRVSKCLQQYVEAYGKNQLVSITEQYLAILPVYFNFNSAQQTLKPDCPDLQLLSQGNLKLETVSDLMLEKKTALHKLSTIFRLEEAQERFNISIYKEESNTKAVSSKKSKLTSKSSAATIYKQLLKQNPQAHHKLLQESIVELISLIANRKQQKQFLICLLIIRDQKITNALYLNLIYSLLNDKKQKNLKSVEMILKNLFTGYLLKQEEQQRHIKRVLLTAHKNLENWKGKNISNARVRNSSSISKEANQIYWQILLSSTSKNNLILYAREFEKINCVKQSIYLRQRSYQRERRNNISHSQKQHLIMLHSRLDPHMQICLPYVRKFTAEIEYEMDSNLQQNKHEWSQYFTQILRSGSSILPQIMAEISRISLVHLQQIQQINQILHQLALLTLFANFIQEESNSLNQLIAYTRKFNNWNLSSTIIQLLMKGPELNSQNQRNIYRFYWEQILRYRKIEEGRKLLKEKGIKEMSMEEVRAAILFENSLGNYDKVRCLYKRVQNQRKYRQQLEIYNMEASYKSVLVYPTSFIVKNIQSIMDSFEDSVEPTPINEETTSNFYEAFRFICQNYNEMSLRDSIDVVKVLLRYIDVTVKHRKMKKQEQKESLKYSIEAMYFLIRFLIKQCYEVEPLISLIPFNQYSGCLIQPHQSFVINSIGLNAGKNKLIFMLLVKVAEFNPMRSAWWIYSLLNHCQQVNENQTQHRFEKTDRVIEEMGVKILANLNQKRLNLQEELEWLKWFHHAAPGQVLKKVPKLMRSPFSKDIVVKSVDRISALGQGKSRPMLISCTVERNSKISSVKFIRKQIKENYSGYQTESSTANFFKDCGLVDQDVTYSIVHLSKYCLLIEHIQHKATLDALMMKNLHASEALKLNQLFLSKEKLQLKQMGPQLYKEYVQEKDIRYELDQLFLGEGVSLRVWWSRYINFIKTSAQWSFLGYVIGLGDRHTNNILVTEEGKVIHIDFEYILDAGKILLYPEWVPFRFTKALSDSLSIIEPYGLFYSQFVKSAQDFEKKGRSIWKAMSHFDFFKKKNISRALCDRGALHGRVYEQALELIDKAVDPIYLSDMFIGWGAYK